MQKRKVDLFGPDGRRGPRKRGRREGGCIRWGEGREGGKEEDERWCRLRMADEKKYKTIEQLRGRQRRRNMQSHTDRHKTGTEKTLRGRARDRSGEGAKDRLDMDDKETGP